MFISILSWSSIAGNSFLWHARQSHATFAAQRCARVRFHHLPEQPEQILETQLRGIRGAHHPPHGQRHFRVTHTIQTHLEMAEPKFKSLGLKKTVSAILKA